MNTKALYSLTYGVYLLSARENGRDNACIINTAVQIANDPGRISVAVIKGGCTHDMILETNEFNVSPLTVDAPFDLFKHFGMQTGRNAEKCEGRRDLSRSANGVIFPAALFRSRTSEAIRCLSRRLLTAKRFPPVRFALMPIISPISR